MIRFISCSVFLFCYFIAFAPQVSAQHVEFQKIKINENGFTSSKVCAQCHTEIYDKWLVSLHAMSTSDPIFRASYMEAHYKSRGKAEKICLRCHAPTVKITHGYDLDAGLTSEGLTCDFCHSVKDVDLSNKEYPFILDLGLVKYGPNKKGDVKVHDIKYSKLHSDAKMCASCHEYVPNGVPVMTTYSEWLSSPYAEQGVTCQKCHMPKIKGRITNTSTGKRAPDIFDHRLAGGYSIMQLQKTTQLKITGIVRKKSRMTVEVSVTNTRSGHRLPTGMPTRKVVLYCEARAGNGQVYKSKIVYEKVIFDKDGFELTNDADIMLGYGASIAKDNRIFPKEMRKESFTFYIPGNRKVKVVAWLDYLYQPTVLQETEMRIEMKRDDAISSSRAKK